MVLLLETKAKEININPLDWPRCAVCHMPVEKFILVDTCDDITFMVLCHGQEQVVQIPSDVLGSMLGSQMKFGLAFSEEHERTDSI